MTTAVASPEGAVETPAVETPAVETPAVETPVVAAPIVIGEPETPAVETPAVAEEPAADGAVTYEPTGDAALDVALAFVGKLGITADDPAMMATATGDFSLIKAKLATMGASAAGWEQMVALAEGSHERATTAANERNAKITSAVHSTCPGADDAAKAAHWQTVQTWASANADPAEKAELNAMFAGGPVSARAAANMLVELHARASGTVVTPANAVTSPGANGAVAMTPLSPKQYADEVRQLVAKVGSHNLSSNQEYIALGLRLSA